MVTQVGDRGVEQYNVIVLWAETIYGVITGCADYLVITHWPASNLFGTMQPWLNNG